MQWRRANDRYSYSSHTAQPPPPPPQPPKTVGTQITHTAPRPVEDPRAIAEREMISARIDGIKARARQILQTQWSYWESNNRALLNLPNAIVDHNLQGLRYHGNPITLTAMNDYIADDTEFAWNVMKGLGLIKMEYGDYSSYLMSGGNQMHLLGADPPYKNVVKDDNVFSNTVTQAWTGVVNTGVKVANTAADVVDTANNIVGNIKQLTDPGIFQSIGILALAAGGLVLYSLSR